MPVGFSVRATTMPPNSSDSMPSELLNDFKISSCVSMPNPIRALAPSSTATVMSTTSNAIARITAAKMPRVR